MSHSKILMPKLNPTLSIYLMILLFFTTTISVPAGTSPDTLDLLDQIQTDNKPSILKKIKSQLKWGSPERKAQKAYKNKKYEEATQYYSEAELDQPESPRIAYNLGNSYYKQKKYDKAILRYKKAFSAKDSKLSSEAYYNAGNSYFRQAEFSIQQGKQEGINEYRQAMAHYKKTLEINPNHQNAKRNIEVVQVRIKELLEQQKQNKQQNNQNQNSPPPPEPSEKAKQVMARVKQLVIEGKYKEAHQLLQSLIETDETAISYKENLQRLQDVISIQKGEMPAPPTQQDPRQQQQGLGVI